jgi:hypothetical protein
MPGVERQVYLEHVDDRFAEEPELTSGRAGVHDPSNLVLRHTALARDPRYLEERGRR